MNPNWNRPLAALPLDLWADFWERRLANFLTASIGDPQEEHVDLRSIAYSEVRSSWERINANGDAAGADSKAD